MKNIFTIILLLILGCRITLAQQGPLQVNITPPSPNAASLGTYGEIPVSQYTGIPNIQIPIYEIKTQALSLPITLSYHASGVKVAQEASWVGLGWTLHAGGVITRTTRGVDDFDTNPLGFYYNSKLPPNNSVNNGDSLSEYIGTYAELYAGNRDSEPDLFYFNFGGYSGQMVYSGDGAWKPLESNNLKFEYRLNDSSWLIYSSEGIKYVFRTKEIATNYHFNSDFEYDDLNPDFTFRDIDHIDQRQPTTITSWYLDSIVAPTNDYILFKYENTNHQIASLISTMQKCFMMTNFRLVGSSGSGYLTGELHGKYDFHYASQTVTNEVYLQEITTRDGLKISFSTGDRTDMLALNPYKAQKLTSISISHNLSTQLSRQYTFYHSYTSSTTFDYKTQRLLLDSLSYSSGGQTTPPYRFSYYSGEGSPSFPAKNSKSIDHWGYYNGAQNESESIWGYTGNKGTLIPSYTDRATGRTFGGANRQPHESLALIGTLTKIVYPTGGFTSFEYELNDYPKKDSIGEISSKIYRAVASDIPNDSIYRTSQTTTFTITKPSLVEYSYNAFSPTAPKTCGDANDITINYTNMTGVDYATLSNNDGTVSVILRYNDWKIGCSIPIWPENKTINLPAGTYTIRTYLKPAYPGFRTMIQVSIPDTPIVSPYYTSVKAGGLRIKSITSNTGQQTIKKSYQYVEKKSDGLTGSSGILMSPPINFFTAEIFNQNVMPMPGNVLVYNYIGSYVCGQSGSVIPLGTSARGNSIGYSRVVETIDTSGSQGQTVYYFINIPEQVNITPPFLPDFPNTTNYGNGLLYRLEYYTGKQLTKSLGRSYFREKKSVVKGLKMYTLPLADPPPSLPNFVKFYDNSIEWWKKEADTITDYSISGTITTVSSYEYDTTNLLVNKKTTYDSRQVPIINKLSYAHNQPGETLTSTAVIAAMKDKNMIGIPIKDEKYVGGIRTNGSINNYGINLLPAGVQTLELNVFKKKMEIDNYDSNGNVTQFHEENNINISYLWGYNKSKPVIEAKGISYSSLETGISQVLKTLGYTNGIQQLDNFLISLGALTTSTQKSSLLNFYSGIKSNTLLKDAFLKLYIHDPLLGVTSIVFENGNILYYEYDAFGRLKIIRDREAKILKQNDYQYQKPISQ